MSYVSEKRLRRATALFAGLFVIAAMALAFSLGGCAARVAHVTDLPAGVTEAQVKNWDAAVADLHRVATLVTAVRQGVIDARNAGVFPSDVAYAETLRKIGNVAILEANAATFLASTPKAFGLPQKQFLDVQMQSILKELQAINIEGETGIKNQQSLATINSILAEIGGTANLILSLKL